MNLSKTVKDLCLGKYKYISTSKRELQSLVDKAFNGPDSEVSLDEIYTGYITDFAGLFTGKDFRNVKGSVENWDVRNGRDFSQMFFNAVEFNQDISKWDTSNAQDMHFMFFMAEHFNQDIGTWDVSNVTNFKRMFYFVTSFNQNLENWNVRPDANTTEMFVGTALKRNNKLPSWYKE